MFEALISTLQIKMLSLLESAQKHTEKRAKEKLSDNSELKDQIAIFTKNMNRLKTKIIEFEWEE
ncbi:MAG: hypothetical protein V3U58_04470 [Thermodesulfobacteriota bacterium]